MKALARIFVVLLAVAVLTGGIARSAEEPSGNAEHGQAAEGGAHGGEAKGEGEGHGTILWKWANFALLAGGLGYLIGKNAGPFFAARSTKIRKDMLDAHELIKQSEARAAEVERRLKNLQSDIDALREVSKKEAEAEGERVARQTEVEIAKVRANAEQEIASAAKAARMDLKRYSAGLALELAERKIRGRMTPATQDALVEGFVQDLDHPSTKAQTT
jgi:F-type H+-transporting ATPase subunit b